MRPRVRWLVLVCALLGIASTTARAQLCPHLDFDNDGNPATWRTELPVGETQGMLDLIVDTGMLAPVPGWIQFEVNGSYCTDSYLLFTKIGASLAWPSFDPAYVDSVIVDAPVCLTPSPQCFGTTYFVHARISEAGAQLLHAHHSYVLGWAMATGDCSAGICQTAHDIYVTLAPSYRFPPGPAICSDTVAHARFVCDSGSPALPSTWGAIKATYR